MASGRLVGGLILAIVLGLLFPAWANAPTSAVVATPPQPLWYELSAAQQTILAPLKKDWDDMEAYRRKTWLGISARYPHMSPPEQKRMQRRMREWARMTPEQRKKVRDQYKEFKQLNPAQKQAVKQKWKAYAQLSDEEKERLKEGKRPPQPFILFPEIWIPPGIEEPSPPPPSPSHEPANPFNPSFGG